MLPDFDNHIDYQGYYSRYIGKLRLLGNQLTGLCPFHEDTQQSFGVNTETGQWICRAGCGSGNVIDFHARINNLSKGEAVADLIKTYNVPEEPTRRSARKPEPAKPEAITDHTIPLATLNRFQPIPDVPLEYLVKRRGWSREIIQKYQIGFQSKGKRKAFTIPVFDASGELVNIRTYAPETQEKIKSWGKGYGEARLYPISVLSKARENGNAVFLCEGEPDTLCGISKGLHCITQTAGAETWKDAFNAEFKGMDVIICYDNDEAGRKGAARVARYLPSFARSVSILQWPEWMQDKEDLTDWFVKYGKTAEELMELERGAPGKSGDQGASENPAVLALNEKHALIRMGGDVLVLNEEEPDATGRREITFSSTHAFVKWYASDTIPALGKHGEPSEINIAKLWLKSKNQRKYNRIVFSPGVECNGNYNLYRGMVTQPKPGNWSLMQRHIHDNIASKDPKFYDYIIYWLADLFQNPGGPRPGTALALRGGQGVGKGSFANQVGAILGNHYLHITNQYQFIGRFNSHLKDALFVFVDEGVWAGDKSAEGVLKGMITEDWIMVEAKGHEPYSVQNHLRLIIASNNSWSVPAGFGERRFCVVDVADTKQQDHKYFAAIEKQMNNGGREAMLYDLLNTDISRVNLRDFPKSKALEDQVARTMNSALKYWMDRLSFGTIGSGPKEWNNLVSTKELHASYVNFCDTIGERHKMPATLFIREIRKVCRPIKGTGAVIMRERSGGLEREWLTRFPDLDECRKRFEAALGFAVDWEDQEG